MDIYQLLVMLCNLATGWLAILDVSQLDVLLQIYNIQQWFLTKFGSLVSGFYYEWTWEVVIWDNSGYEVNQTFFSLSKREDITDVMPFLIGWAHRHTQNELWPCWITYVISRCNYWCDNVRKVWEPCETGVLWLDTGSTTWPWPHPWLWPWIF